MVARRDAGGALAARRAVAGHGALEMLHGDGERLAIASPPQRAPDHARGAFAQPRLRHQVGAGDARQGVGAERGVLAPLTPESAGKLRAFLLRALSR